MGNVSIDLSLMNIWQAWYKFRQGKIATKELNEFEYNLEYNLWRLYIELKNNVYYHEKYKHFTVRESKRRDIAVANIRDRIVHRLVYDYLTEIFDKTFIFDVWSCRKNKGLTGAVERTEKMLKKYPNSFVWRADITKFFDNVRQDVLLSVINRRVKDKKTIKIIATVIKSYKCRSKYDKEGNFNDHGIPIGNLTSQIFANIYLNELDRFVCHTLKPKFYLRYGDDFIIIEGKREILQNDRFCVINYLSVVLGLEINPKNDIIVPMRKGIYFLGVEIYPTGRRLKKRIWLRACNRLNTKNAGSYRGIIKQNDYKKIKYFDWLIYKTYE